MGMTGGGGQAGGRLFAGGTVGPGDRRMGGGLVTVLCRCSILLGGFGLESEWADAPEV